MDSEKDVLSTDFMIGDMIKCIKNHNEIKIGDIFIVEGYKDTRIILHKMMLYNLYFSKNKFELYKRKIGDHWFKAHELHIHENALPPDIRG